MILIPDNEKREFKYGILPNNLKYTIIYDKSADTSNVVMSVNTGTLYEPLEYMGLAHFLEHMLFMGSSKYTDEDYYFKKLKEFGGNSNAYTDDIYTVYYFDILSVNLNEMIDIFSRFFIDPLFNINSVSREINAVNSEHLKNLNNDNWVLRQIINNISKKDSIINRFGTGSHKTFGTNIEKLRNAMISFYNKYYCANNMCITIQSSRPINEIEKMIKKSFSDIKQKKIVHPIIPMSKFSSFNNEYHLITVDDVNIINYIWEMPEFKEFNDNKIIDIIRNGILFNCKNNIENYLIENNLANNIDIGYFDTGIFILSIEVLPNKSKDVYYKINDIVEYYFNHLKYFNWNLVYDYNVKLYELNYNNQMKGSNADLAMKICLNMHIFDEEHVYNGHKLVIKKDYVKLMKCLDYLKFDKVNIIYATQTKLGSNYKKDKYYEKYYCKLSKSFINNNIINNNNYNYNFNICINSDMLNIKPKIIKNLDKYNIPKKMAPKFWYGGVSKFKEPIVLGEICIQSHKFFNSKRTLLTTVISIKIINYYMNLLFSNEINIGYNIKMTLNYRTSSISLIIDGYNDKYIDLFNRVVEQIVDINPSDTLIKSNISLFKQSLENVNKSSAWELSTSLLSTMINKYIYYYKDELKEIKNITIDMIKERINKLINIRKQPITTTIYGCIDNKHLHNIITFNSNNKIDKISSMKMPNSITIKHPNKKEINICISYVFPIHTKKMNPLLSAKLVLLNAIMERPAFDVLRTKMQLGYLVRCKLVLDDISYIRLSVMSPLDYKKVEDAMETFINTSMKEIFETTTTSDFNNLKKSIYDILTEKHNSLTEMANSYLGEITIQEYMFDRNIRIANKIKHISLNDIVDLYHSIIKVKKVIKVV